MFAKPEPSGFLQSLADEGGSSGSLLARQLQLLINLPPRAHQIPIEHIESNGGDFEDVARKSRFNNIPSRRSRSLQVSEKTGYFSEFLRRSHTTSTSAGCRVG
jgi:hypothetical protein